MPIPDPTFVTHARDPDVGFDVVIVSASTAAGAARWQERLEATRGQILRDDAEVVVIHEDWPGGAGNGLGTLFALVRAAARLPGLWDRVEGGASVGLWHTAGRGQRLYPLPAATHGDKSATRLPGLVRVDGRAVPITLLEAVLRQTSPFAVHGPGRIHVFWGDQLVAPTVPPAAPAHPVSLLGRVGPVPDAARWRAERLDQYGLLAIQPDGRAVQLEKIGHARFHDLALSEAIGAPVAVATSLGSFSMAADVARALCDGFSAELSARSGRLDSDPGWWMPLSLPEADYVALRGSGARRHHRRMRAMLGALPLGVVDLGWDAPWWDFGRTDTWFASCRATLDPSPAGAALRAFLGAPDPVNGSLVLASDIAGTVKDSVVVGVRAARIDAHGAVLIDVAADRLVTHGAAASHARDAAMVVPTGHLRVDVDGEAFHSRIDGDGKADWEVPVCGNRVSWATLHARQ